MITKKIVRYGRFKKRIQGKAGLKISDNNKRI